MAVQIHQRGHHLGDGVHTLDRYFADLEASGGPAGPGVDLDVTLRRAVATADEADPARQERQRLLELVAEQSFLRQPPAQLFQLPQGAHPDRLELGTPATTANRCRRSS